MTRTSALAIGRAVQQHPFDGLSLQERIANEITKAYEAGRQSVLDEQGAVTRAATTAVGDGASGG
jgi:hypothetical protein